MTLFPSPILLLCALIFGALFGFLLRKATVSRFDVIIGQLLLRDFTVMKVILTAIVTGSCGIYLCNFLGFIPTFHLSKTPVLWTMLGGGIFGVGMAVTGYCPGTALAAIAEGSKDVLFALTGMIFGSFIFNAIYFYLRPFIEKKDAMFQQTLPSLLHLPNWNIILLLLISWVLFAISIRKVRHSEGNKIAG